MLIRPNMTTPAGEVRADARACDLAVMSLKHRAVEAIGTGFYGTGVSQNDTTMRPEGLGGSAG